MGVFYETDLPGTDYKLLLMVQGTFPPKKLQVFEVHNMLVSHTYVHVMYHMYDTCTHHHYSFYYLCVNHLTIQRYSKRYLCTSLVICIP